MMGPSGFLTNSLSKGGRVDTLPYCLASRSALTICHPLRNG